MAQRAMKVRVEEEFTSMTLKLYKIKGMVQEDEKIHRLMQVGSISALVDLLEVDISESENHVL